MSKLKELIENEYGLRKMKLHNIWVCFLFAALVIFINWVINNNTYGIIFDFVFKYLRVFIISTGISIFSAILFSNGIDNKILKFFLTILVCTTLGATLLILIPIALLLKTKQFLEILSRFRLDETKLIVYMVSLTISLLISAIYFGIGIVFYPLIDQHFDSEYLFILIFMGLFILSFNLLSKWTYKLYITTTKSYFYKRRLLQAYYQDFKEKNIVLFIILFFATLYMYAQKSQDNIMLASTSSITTIILLDALVDKWKNKFHKADTEYRFVEFLNMDIQMVNSQIGHGNFTNVNLKLKPNDHLELMRNLSMTTTNKSFEKIIVIYETLVSEYQPYDRFTESLFNLESKIITYIIRCN